MSAAAGTQPARESSGSVPTGNLFDKYGSRNLVVRALMGRFDGALNELLDRAAPASVLDVGCGEGVITERWSERLETRRVVGVDLDDPGLRAQWEGRRRSNLGFVSVDGSRLPFADGEFDLVAAIEVLEHLENPERALAEMARVAARHLLVSVPREPLWRVLNIARGAYLRDLGNTPGHLSHWSRSAFVRLLGRYGDVVENRAQLPWTILLVRLP